MIYINDPASFAERLETAGLHTPAVTAAAVLLWDRLLVEGRQDSPLFAEFVASAATPAQPQTSQHVTAAPTPEVAPQIQPAPTGL